MMYKDKINVTHQIGSQAVEATCEEPGDGKILVHRQQTDRKPSRASHHVHAQIPISVRQGLYLSLHLPLPPLPHPLLHPYYHSRPRKPWVFSHSPCLAYG